MSVKKNNITSHQYGSLEIVRGRGNVVLPYHTHNCFIIGIITRGQMHMVIDEQNYIMEPGMVYIVPSNIGISMQYITEFSYTTICFKNELADYMNSYNIESYAVSDVGFSILELWQRHTDSNTDSDFISDIISLLDLHKKESMSSSNPLIIDAVTYINNHLEEKCSVEEIAKSLFISKFYFSRLFKKEMSITPKQYILQAKLRIVKDKVLESRTETRIAEDMDFAAQSHMCSVFKKYMGISIRDYKKHLIQDIMR